MIVAATTTKTKKPQQNMLKQFMSHKTNKKKQTKRPQQNMLKQLMSHTTNNQKKKKKRKKNLDRTY